jgi:hypothetical protein
MKPQLALLLEPTPKPRYTLTVPTLSFAGLLHGWAQDYGIECRHSVTGAGKRYSSNSKTALPIILEFDSAADRTWLMEIARAQIAMIRTPKPRRGPGLKNKSTVDRNDIADRLQAAYEALS